MLCMLSSAARSVLTCRQKRPWRGATQESYHIYFEDANVHTLDREDSWFERGVKEANQVKLKQFHAEVVAFCPKHSKSILTPARLPQLASWLGGTVAQKEFRPKRCDSMLAFKKNTLNQSVGIKRPFKWEIKYLLKQTNKQKKTGFLLLWSCNHGGIIILIFHTLQKDPQIFN